jgi:D-serine deaminase-like pyridoxal phosphate-dependent protein
MDPRWQPARTGDAVEDVDTPALLLDLDRFERNLARVMNAVGGQVRVRPHAKSHKCVEIARRQVAAGCVGVCVQKTSEAEPFVAGGINDVLITNEVVGARKLRALADLARRHPQARLGVCVDDPEVVRQLGRVCDELDARLDVYIELDVGQARCGVATPEEVVPLARAIVAHGRLTFMGLQAYHGSAQHRRGVPERKDVIARAADKAAAARAALRAAQLPCEIITGGGTGTFMYEAASGVYQEVQPGSFALMDVDYARNEQDPTVPRFEHALTILASVMSLRSNEGHARATLDAGLKAFATDSGNPVPAFSGWQVRSVSDEHTVLHRVGEGVQIALGDKALLIPSHCDPTVNLHDWIVAVRGGKVEGIWPVDARGAVY